MSIAVPPDAEQAELQPIDSVFGVLKGSGYEIIYDYGRSAEELDAEAHRPRFKRWTRSVRGHNASEAFFEGDDQPWHVVRILQVPLGSHVLTIRVSCRDEVTCRLAEQVFESVGLGTA